MDAVLYETTTDAFDRDVGDFLEEVRAALRACFDAEEHHAAMAAWRRRKEPS